MDGMTVAIVAGSVLLTVLAVGGSLVAIFRIFGGMGKASAERDRLLREGIQASARLIAVQMGGMSVSIGAHRHLQLHLQLEVQPQGQPPYPTMLTTMVSELQIPQLQPGAMLTIRIDRNDPSKLALEGAGSPAPQPYGAQPYGAQPYGAQPYGAQPYGAPGIMPAMVPFGPPPTVPAGAKIGLWLGVGGAVVGLIVAVIVVLVNVGGAGLDSASEGDGVCAQAIRCCEVVAAGNASAANCKNMGKLGVPTNVCQQTLKSMQDSARALGKTCH